MSDALNIVPLEWTAGFLGALRGALTQRLDPGKKRGVRFDFALEESELQIALREVTEALQLARDSAVVAFYNRFVSQA